MKSKVTLLFGAMVLALLLASGTALAALKMGTDGPDTLVGTHSADQITGGGGDDVLKGLAGNDVYYFDDGWGKDTLVEPATQKVKKKGKWRTISGGIDTLSFSQMDLPVDVFLIPQIDYNFVTVDETGIYDHIDLGTSVVENVTGGRGEDDIRTGSGANTLSPGGGKSNKLWDYGGASGSSGGPGLPASNDTFKGFEDDTEALILDLGGTADTLDLRPFASSEVYVTAIDGDVDGVQESLQIVTGPSTQVLVIGQFGEYFAGQQMRIERLLFSDGAFSGEGTAGTSSAASVSSEQTSADSVEKLMDDSAERAKTTEEGAELKKAAEKLQKEAQKEMPKDPLPQPSAGEGER